MKATAFLMTQGDAKAALAPSREAFPELKVLETQGHPDRLKSGQVAAARVCLGGSEWRPIDSPCVHAFAFTPSARSSSIATTKPGYTGWPGSLARAGAQ